MSGWYVRFALVFLGFVFASSPATADVVVRRLCLDSSGNIVSTTVIRTAQSGELIEINPTSLAACGGDDGRSSFRITGGSTDDIGIIRFVGQGGNLVNDVLLTSNQNVAEVNSSADFADTGASWAGLEPGPYPMQVQASIGGNLTGPVTAGNVTRLLIGGTITAAADISQTASVEPVYSIIAEGDIHGDVSAAGNNIAFVRSLSGSISSAISASDGTVLQVRADIGTLSGTVTSARGEVSLIKANHITGTILANGRLQGSGDYYAIGTVEATADIGTPTVPATITTDAGPRAGTTTEEDPGYYNGGIRLVRARNIYANITTPVPTIDPLPPYSADNKRGDIRELVTTGTGPGNGKVAGTISTFTFGDFGAGPTFRTMNIRGDLEADILVAGTIKNLVQVSGNVTSGASLVLLEQDLTARGDITITGTLAGTVSVDGNKLGDLKILPGSMTGLIHIGGDLRSRLTVGGTIAPTALIAIDGDVDAVFSGPNQLDSITFTGASAMAGPAVDRRKPARICPHAAATAVRRWPLRAGDHQPERHNRDFQ